MLEKQGLNTQLSIFELGLKERWQIPVRIGAKEPLVQSNRSPILQICILVKMDVPIYPVGETKDLKIGLDRFLKPFKGK